MRAAWRGLPTRPMAEAFEEGDAIGAGGAVREGAPPGDDLVVVFHGPSLSTPLWKPCGRRLAA